jgi:hypothetical protein
LKFQHFHFRYIWSSVLVSSALSVFLRGAQITSHEEEVKPHTQMEVYQDHRESCGGSPSCGLDACSANVTPLAVVLGANDAHTCIASRESSSGVSSDALPSPISEMGKVAEGAVAAVDGLSLVHRSAGSLFVQHVLSKGNSVDVWQGFLSFIGKSFCL